MRERDLPFGSGIEAFANAKPSPYVTKLHPIEQSHFLKWVNQNQIPYDPSPQADYDMPGFWQDMRFGRVQGPAINPFDGQPHFTDARKTPFHQSFSNESIYALPTAPRWINDYQLANQLGTVMFDERLR